MKKLVFEIYYLVKFWVYKNITISDGPEPGFQGFQKKQLIQQSLKGFSKECVGISEIGQNLGNWKL